jgi:hypothetical protein
VQVLDNHACKQRVRVETYLLTVDLSCSCSYYLLSLGLDTTIVRGIHLEIWRENYEQSWSWMELELELLEYRIVVRLCNHDRVHVTESLRVAT